MCPSRRCSEMDDNQSLTMATYTKLCGNLPYLIYLLPMTIYETSNWMPRRRYMYRLPCRTEYNPDYYSRDQIKCRTAEITMQITMPITMPYLFRSYITENTIPNKIPTQTRRSRTTTMMTIDHCKSTSESSPSNRCSLRSHLRLVAGGATTFKRRGWSYRNRNPYRKQLPSRKCRNEAP